MKTLMFAGCSDDTFGEYGVTMLDYDNCAKEAPIQVVVTGGGTGLVVIGHYHIHPTDGCWAIGISLLSGDMPLPEWPVRFVNGSTPYSPVLEIDVPDDFELKWYSNGIPAEAM